MNRRGFLAAFVAGLIAPRVTRLPALKPGELLRTGMLTVGPGGEFTTLRQALAVAAPGAIVYVLSGHTEGVRYESAQPGPVFEWKPGVGIDTPGV